MDTTTLEQLRSRIGQVVATRKDAEVTVLESVLDQTMLNHAGLQWLLVSSSDGRALAVKSPQASADPRRVAAMGNAFLTLGQTMARELGLSAAGHATVSTGSGNVVLIRVDGPAQCTLLAMADATVPLAVVLYAARECARKLAPLL